jgi:signal transduction histidine kinase
MRSGQAAYDGPRAHSKGHREYDLLLKRLIEAVARHTSRESLLNILLDELKSISSADAIVVLEYVPVRGSGSTFAGEIRGFGQRGIHPKRWHQFCETHSKAAIDDDLLHKVLCEEIDVDLWGSDYFPSRFAEFRSLFDTFKGGWLSGIHLPPATANQNARAIFVWYTAGADQESVPRGGDQDWRLLGMFRLCYSMATFHLRQAARTIIMQRQELLRSLTPAILSHEVFKRVEYTLPNISIVKEELRRILQKPCKLELATSENAQVRDLLVLLDESIHPALSRLKEICESVMNLRRRVAKGPVDPVKEVVSACNLLYQTAATHGVLLETPPSPEAPILIESDPALLMHVVTNLISNSIEAFRQYPDGDISKPPVPTVSCRVAWNDDDGDGLPLTITIQDNGPGVEEAKVSKIFEPGITTKPSGHGLGLAVCRMIVNYLGGSVDLVQRRSPTSFQVRLPRVAEKIDDLEEEMLLEAEI